MSTNSESNNRVIYLDALRLVALAAVVVIHVSASQFSKIDHTSQLWMIHAIYDSLARWAVPVFVMISGAVFLNIERSITIKKILTKYVPRLIVAYFVWSIIYLVFQMILQGYTAPANELIKKILEGHYHLWYIPMLIGLYLIVPVLRYITENKKMTEYYLLLVLLFTFAIPSFLELMQLIDGRVYAAVSIVTKKLQLNMFSGYAGYFVLGKYLNDTSISKTDLRKLYLAGFIAFIYTAVLTIVSSHFYGYAYTGFLNNNSINVLVESVSVFLFVKNHCNSLPIIKMENTIQKLAKYTFGVYLIHVLVKDMINTYLFTTVSFNPVLSVLIMALLIIAISIVLVSILNKIPLINRTL